MTEEIKLIKLGPSVSWADYCEFIVQENLRFRTTLILSVGALWVALLVGFLFFA